MKRLTLQRYFDGLAVVGNNFWNVTFATGLLFAPVSKTEAATATNETSTANPARLAILVQGPSLAAVADLLTAELSQKQNVQLLERTEIDRVYREQALGAGDKDLLKLGQIIGADGLLTIGLLREGTNQVLQAALLAVRPGVVLSSIALPRPVSNEDQWTRGLAKHFEPFLPKLAVLAKDAVPISVVNLRSAVRTPALERELTLLLVHRLAQQKEVFVLERQHLREALFEQQLKPEDESPFWTGRYLLDGTLDNRGFAPDKVTVTARLVPPGGGSPVAIEVAGPRADPLGVAESLAAKVLSALKQETRTSDWDPRQEAEQFYAEAMWAYRWGVLPEAQTASESAWALGKRDKQLATVRLQAYYEDVLPDDDFGNILVPAVPNPSRIAPAIRAAELFWENSPLAFTNQAAPDPVWYELGLRALRRASGLLDGFYYAAELRQGNEEQLSSLRTAVRTLVSVLATNSPLRRISQNPRDVALLSWEQGGLWFDRPVESLPLFRRTLEAGYNPKDLPRIIGWNWSDRKEAPALTRQLLRTFEDSASPAVRLEGLYLTLLDTPFDSSPRFQQCEQKLMAALWDHRLLLYTNSARATLLMRTERALSKKYGFIFDPPFKLEPFASLRQRLRVDFLRQTNVWNREVFSEIFNNPEASFSSAEAQELLPLLTVRQREFSTQDALGKWVAAEIDVLVRRFQNLAGADKLAKAPAAPPAKTQPALKGATPRRLKLVEWSLKRPGIEPGRLPRWENPLLHGGRLWVLLRYARPGNLYLDLQSTYAAIDLKSGACDEFAFPPSLGFPDLDFEVTDDALFASAQDRVLRFRLRDQTWDSIPVPMDRGARITALHDRLYLATEHSLLELAPDSQEVRLLVSARRRPAANEVDELWGATSQLYPRADGTLGVVASNRLFALDFKTGTWVATAPLPAGIKPLPSPFALRTLAVAGGVQFQLMGSGKRGFVTCVLASWPDAPAVQILATQTTGSPGSASEPKDGPGSTRWDWPESLSLEYSCIRAAPNEMWVLSPRNKWHLPGRPEETGPYADQRHATLLHFTAASRAPQMIGVEFEKDGQLTDAFRLHSDATHSFSFPVMPPRPMWLETDDSLVMASAGVAGHWLLPKTGLDQDQKTLHQNASKQLAPISEERSSPPPGAAPSQTRRPQPAPES